MFPVLIIVIFKDPFIISILMLVTQVTLRLAFKNSWFNPAVYVKITGNKYMWCGEKRSHEVGSIMNSRNILETGIKYRLRYSYSPYSLSVVLWFEFQ